MQTVQILESHQKNFPKTYSDYFLNWYNFTQKYNFAIFDAGLDAFQSLFSLESKPTNAKKIENFVRASFDSTLRKSLEEEEFATSLGKFIEAFTEMASLTRHNLVHKYFDDLYVNLNVLIEPFRNSINRTSLRLLKWMESLIFCITRPQYQ